MDEFEKFQKDNEIKGALANLVYSVFPDPSDAIVLKVKSNDGDLTLVMKVHIGDKVGNIVELPEELGKVLGEFIALHEKLESTILGLDFQFSTSGEGQVEILVEFEY